MGVTLAEDGMQIATQIHIFNRRLGGQSKSVKLRGLKDGSEVQA